MLIIWWILIVLQPGEQTTDGPASALSIIPSVPFRNSRDSYFSNIFCSFLSGHRSSASPSFPLYFKRVDALGRKKDPIPWIGVFIICTFTVVSS